MLEQLKKSLAEKLKGIEVLQTTAFAEAATADDQTAFEKAVKDLEDIEAKIKTAESLERIRAKAAVPSNSAVNTDNPAVSARAIEKMTPEEKLGAISVMLLKSFKQTNRTDPDAVLDMFEKSGQARLAEVLVQEKALSTIVSADGGVTIAPEFMEELIPALMPYTAFLRGNPQRVAMPKGNFRQSGEATRPVANWRGEGAQIDVSQPTFRDLNLNAKLLSSLVPINNELISWSGNRAYASAQRTMLQSIGIKLDATAFEAVGTANVPAGIYKIAGILTRADTNTTTPTIAEVDAAVRPAVNAMAMYENLDGTAWVMPQRVIGYLQDLRDGNGNFAYPTMQGESPVFKGYPVLKTNQVAINGGAGTNEATISLVSFPNIYYGESGGLALAVSDTATYKDGGAVVISAFQHNQTLIRATMEVDWDVVYNEAVYTITAVKWGG